MQLKPIKLWYALVIIVILHKVNNATASLLVDMLNKTQLKWTTPNWVSTEFIFAERTWFNIAQNVFWQNRQ